jgi:hypothetical protein
VLEMSIKCNFHSKNDAAVVNLIKELRENNVEIDIFIIISIMDYFAKKGIKSVKKHFFMS